MTCLQRKMRDRREFMSKVKVKQPRKKIRWARYIPIYFLTLPGMIYLIINNYLPMFGIVIAFKDLDFRKGLLKSDWCGFENFKYLFRSKDALIITRNTVLYNVVFIIFGVILGITVAILLNEVRGRLKVKFFQSVILIPYLMSWVVVSYLVYAVFSAEVGFVNNSILKPMGSEPTSLYLAAD